MFDLLAYESGGWRSALAEELYERLEMAWDEEPGVDEIQEAYQTRYRWWMAWDQVLQRGGHAPPLLQEIGPFISRAMQRLAEARTVLTDDEQREEYDAELRRERVASWREKLEDWIAIATLSGPLTAEGRRKLREMANDHDIPGWLVDERLSTLPIPPPSSPPSLPPPPPPGQSLSVTQIRALLEVSGCEIQDKSGNGGCLWVIGGGELEPLMETLQSHGAFFKFSAAGGQATKRRPAWWWKPPQ